jgi:hypothetical protein
MAEVMHVFDTPMLVEGVPYAVQVVGRPSGHVWEGWIEFTSADGTDALRTPRETTQPDRAALAYWATGLSGTYLEGAIRRAMSPPATRQVPREAEPVFESPAPHPAADLVAVDRAVLDPFSVGAKSVDLLRRELGALRAWHLRNIIRAYRLVDDQVELEAKDERALVELIVAAVRSADHARDAEA